jgi:hypothetical protein
MSGHGASRMSPRIAAILLLKEKLDAGKVGLDPYDNTVLILLARQDERIWTNRCLELTGLVLTALEQPGGGIRFRALVEADVRRELGLDGPDAPTMDDEPLASRGVGSLVDRHLEALADPDTPFGAAMIEAHKAYGKRYPYGVTGAS